MPSPDPPAPAIRPFQPPITALLIYPATLIVGSLFSVLSPTAQGTRDDGSSTLYPHAEPLAPSIASDLNLSFPPPRPVNYFARKDNIFNLYFVKVGWLWTTAALAFILLSQPAYTLAASHRARRTGQAVLRYILATTVWYLTTQWFFGPPIIDRSFVLTGGKCERAVPLAENEPAAADVKTLLTAAACKHAGGAWKGGHDVSGHVFLLVLATSLVVFELVGGSQGWGKGGVSVNGNGEAEKEVSEEVDVVRVWSGRFAWAVAGLGWWMLLMTGIWFHTWFEKLTGLLIALGTVYTIYILPRRVLPWRNVVGLPGV